MVATRPFPQAVLYLWDDRTETTATILRETILSSKEHPSFDMMKLWGSEFFRRATIAQNVRSKKNWIIVFPPGRTGRGEADHAGALAEAVWTACGGVLSIERRAFERIGTKSQKTKNRIERRDIAFKISDSFKERIDKAPGFLFIDDVLATGATATAAWKALGRPADFECWAIAFKVNDHFSITM